MRKPRLSTWHLTWGFVWNDLPEMALDLGFCAELRNFLPPFFYRGCFSYSSLYNFIRRFRSSAQKPRSEAVSGFWVPHKSPGQRRFLSEGVSARSAQKARSEAVSVRRGFRSSAQKAWSGWGMPACGRRRTGGEGTRSPQPQPPGCAQSGGGTLLVIAVGPDMPDCGRRTTGGLPPLLHRCCTVAAPSKSGSDQALHRLHRFWEEHTYTPV